MALEPTPWRRWLAAAASRGVAPAEFWRLSLAEWRALAEGGGAPSMGRAQFETLHQLYPDKTHDGST